MSKEVLHLKLHLFWYSLSQLNHLDEVDVALIYWHFRIP